MITCPICYDEVEEKEATTTDLISDYHGERFYFCSAECKGKFDRNPSFPPAQNEQLRRESMDEGYSSASE